MPRLLDPSLYCLLLVFCVTVRTVPANGQARGLVMQPAAQLEVPDGAELFHISGTINNNEPVLASDARFSTELCDRLGKPHTPGTLGAARSQLTSQGQFSGTHFGDAALFVEACLLAPPPTIVASLTLTAINGDVLTLSVRAEQVAESPPPPDSEAMGSGIIVGGTGRFAGASGRFNLSAKSHGEVLPGTGVSTQRDIDIRGYIFLQAGNHE